VHTRDNSSGVVLYAAIIFHTRMQSRIENNNVKAKKNNRFIDIYHLRGIVSYNTYLFKYKIYPFSTYHLLLISSL